MIKLVEEEWWPVFCLDDPIYPSARGSTFEMSLEDEIQVQYLISIRDTADSKLNDIVAKYQV